MAQSLRVNTTRAADAAKGFPASTAAADLTAQAGCPVTAAQFLQLFNLTNAAITAGITLVCEDATSPNLTPSIPANGTLEIYTPIKTLTTPASVTAIAYWWDQGEVVKRQHSVARNP